MGLSMLVNSESEVWYGRTPHLRSRGEHFAACITAWGMKLAPLEGVELANIYYNLLLDTTYNEDAVVASTWHDPSVDTSRTTHP